MSAVILWVISVALIRCDLPVHTRLPEVAGLWAFRLLPLSQTGYRVSAFPTDLIATCGSGLPNHNSENLNTELQNHYIEWLSDNFEVEKGFTRHLEIELGVDRGLTPSRRAGREGWKSLIATEAPPGNNATHSGYWTMIYDEGFEIRLPHRKLTLTALVKYTLDEGCRESEDASEAADGHTDCYRTHPDETLLGWFEQKDAKSSKSMYGCLKGKKIHSAGTSSQIALRERQAVVTGKLKRMKSSLTLTQLKDNLKPQPLWSTASTAAKNPAFESLMRFYSTSAFTEGSPKTSCRAELDAEDDANLPTDYSVGDPFLSPEKMTELDKAIVNQGACGSCYAISSAYVMQKKLEMSGKRLNGSLSTSDVLSCSFYNQGCRGGYPYLVGKWAMQFGLGGSACEDLTPLDSGESMCSLPVTLTGHRNPSFSATQSPGQLLYLSTPAAHSRRRDTRRPHHASLMTQARPPGCARYKATSYGYLGGCFGCSSELAMRRDIFLHGPIVVALEAPASLVLYEDGIFDEIPRNHHIACTSMELAHGISGWEFTVSHDGPLYSQTSHDQNHAIVIVGFGIEHVANADQNGTLDVPYWIARNSWGPDWGRDGYFKILRSVNLGGIENQPVFIDID